jgi:hypothetical protein
VVISGVIAFITLFSPTVESLYDIIGHSGCLIFWNVTIMYLVMTLIGSFGMALYRLIIVKSWLTCFSKQAIMKIILSFELLIYVLSQYLMINSYLVSKSARTMLICTGRSKLMDEIIVNYSFNNVMEKSDVSKLGCLIIIITLTMLEMIMYIIIFVDLYKHNKRMHINQTLPIDAIKGRNKANAFTLSGQVLIFTLEIVLTFIIVSVEKAVMTEHENNSMGIALIFVRSGILPIIQLLTSPELKRHIMN